MVSHKRPKLSDAEDEGNSENEAMEVEGSENESMAESRLSSRDTDDELQSSKYTKSRQTLKRKLRATGASKFGETLQFLLNTDAPSSLPLSLKPSINKKRNDEKLESRAKQVLQIEKKEKEDNRRVKDVIGGWGGEGERALRKVAQRGVVKLFNVIQQSQAGAVVAAEKLKATRGTGKATLLAPTVPSRGYGKGQAKDNVIGRVKESAVGKDDFFDMIRSGGIVSKS